MEKTLEFIGMMMIIVGIFMSGLIILSIFSPFSGSIYKSKTNGKK